MKNCYILLVYQLPLDYISSPHLIAKVNFDCSKTQEAKRYEFCKLNF